MLPDKSAKALYQEMTAKRQPFLDRARDIAKLTIPSLMVEEGHTSASDLPTPFQSVGARGVNNLASKYLLALFPPSAPFLRYVYKSPYKELVKELGSDAEIGGQTEAELEEALRQRETSVQREFETGGYRVHLFETFKHLDVCGNVTLYLPDDGRMRVFHLDQYVAQRDPMGTLTKLITKECIARDLLSPELQALVGKDAQTQEGQSGHKQDYDIYTAACLEGKQWKVWQELEGVRIPDSDGVLSAEDFPWLVLRGTQVSGEDYGRGHSEELFGDLITAEGLSQALAEGAHIAAFILYLTRPNGVTDIADLQGHRSGDFVVGDAEDVTPLQFEKAADLGFADAFLQRVEKRLEMAYMMLSSIQRQAERVTAEEISKLAQDLEDSYGGRYSLYGQEFQLPLVKRVDRIMVKGKRLAPIDSKVLEPLIVTGLDALGRGHEVSRLMALSQATNAAFGPEASAATFHTDEFTRRLATGMSVEAKGLIKTREELAQERQQQQTEALIQDTAPIAAKAMMGGGSNA